MKFLVTVWNTYKFAFALLMTMKSKSSSLHFLSLKELEYRNAIIQSLEGFGLSLGFTGLGVWWCTHYESSDGWCAGKKFAKNSLRPFIGHSLNLAVLNSCSFLPVRNCIDQIKGFTIWIKFSANREGLLKAFIAKRSQVGTNRTLTLTVCG